MSLSRYKSRKFWFAMWSTLLIFLGGFLGAKIAGFAPLYDTMVGGIVGVVAAFLTGNVVGKWVTTKVATKVSEPKAADSKEADK